MNFSENLKIRWYLPPRCGSRSTLKILKFLKFSIDQHSFKLNQNQSDYQTIFNIRNPYFRLKSLFYLHCELQKNYSYNFKKWSMSVLNERLSTIKNNPYDLETNLNLLGKNPNFFVKLENFQEDLIKIPIIQENMNVDLENIFQNAVLSNEYKSNSKENVVYDEELADIVYDKLKYQFEIFEYDKNSWKDGTS
jgi:hypothetical protein